MIKPAFGEILSQARERENLTQEMLAKACDLSARHIQRLEAGAQLPTWESLFLLATALDTTPQLLIAPVWDQWVDAGRPQLQSE